MSSRKALVTYQCIPGVLELVLKENISAAFLNRRPGAPEASDHLVGAEGHAIQRVLHRHDLVQAEPIFSTPSQVNLDAAAAAVETTTSDQDRFFTLHFPTTADLASILREFDDLPHVERVAPVPILFPPSEPTQETFIGSTNVLENPSNMLDNQWYIYRCQIDKAWSLPSGRKTSGKGVVIAVIDWGFRTSHQDFRSEGLGSRIELTFNSMNQGSDVTKGQKIYHGTGVLAQVGAGINGVGLAGVAHGASLWAIQASDTPETTTLKSWVDAIEFVCKTDSSGRRKVILLQAETDKGGNVEMVADINKAIKSAIEKNVVVCIPAGNGDRNAGKDLNDNGFEPTGAIIVGATRYDDDSRAVFEGGLASNWGERVVVSAPGERKHDITCRDETDNDYTNQFGQTSGAAAKVAGVIALMLEVNPALTPEHIRQILGTGTPVSSEEGKPVGVFLNAKAAVCEALKRKGEIC